MAEPGGNRPRALVTLCEVAAPADTGKRLRSAAMLRALSTLADLDVVFLWGNRQPDATPVPHDVPVRSWTVVPHRLARRPAAATAFARGLPWQIASRDWTDARDEIVRRSPQRYDLLWLGSIDHFAVLRDLLGDAPCIVDYDDVEPAKLGAYLAAGTGDRLRRLKARVEARHWQRLEAQAARRADAVLVCSALDVRRLGGPRAAAVPNTYPDPGPPRIGRRTGPPVFLILANYHYAPNVDAAHHVAREILPVLRRTVPDAVVRVAGHRAREVLAPLADVPGLQLVSPVAEVGPLLSEATAVIAPIRYGGGTRLKIIEAFAHGIPVVSTALGAEGLEVTDGRDLLLADTPADFAAACARLAADHELRAGLGQRGRELYERAYRPEVADRVVARLVNDVLARTPAVG